LTYCTFQRNGQFFSCGLIFVLYNMSFFATARSFGAIPAAAGEDIPTAAFLDACAEIVPFFGEQGGREFCVCVSPHSFASC
jgi:hypothetical protein